MDLGHSGETGFGCHDSTSFEHVDDGVHPSVVLRDVASRLRLGAHVIVFANEKGGVGKSTLAFHCCVALANAGKKVLAIDLDRRQQSLETVLNNRDATASSLQLDVPRPRHFVLQKQSGAMLHQEIMRVGPQCDFVVIDAAGHDSAIARFAMGMADTLVTPMNGSTMDLALLGRFDPVSGQFREPGCFAQLVQGLRSERHRRGMDPLDWVVIKNRVRDTEVRLQDHVDRALAQLAPKLGFRLGHGFKERVAYRELFAFGLSHLDRAYFPGLTRSHTPTALEILQLIDDLRLPDREAVQVKRERPRQFTPVGTKSAREFGESLYAYMLPVAQRVADPV
jgi:chromosome partitioning protein